MELNKIRRKSQKPVGIFSKKNFIINVDPDSFSDDEEVMEIKIPIIQRLKKKKDLCKRKSGNYHP